MDKAAQIDDVLLHSNWVALNANFQWFYMDEKDYIT